ncbi:hypothetical protein Tco_1365880 [Tanacetum coccineum]
MTTLAEFMIIAGAENYSPMLDKSISKWSTCMATIVARDVPLGQKKFEELSRAEKLHANCDLKYTNIVLQGLPPDVYAIVNNHKVAKEIWDRVKLLM